MKLNYSARWTYIHWTKYTKLGSSIATEERTLDVELNLLAGEVDWAGSYAKERVRKIIPLTLPVLPMTEKMTVDAENAQRDGTDV